MGSCLLVEKRIIGEQETQDAGDRWRIIREMLEILGVSIKVSSQSVLLFLAGSDLYQVWVMADSE